MRNSAGRNQMWDDWSKNREPVRNTPRREQQLKDLEQQEKTQRRTA